MKVRRWLVELIQELDFRVVYRPGERNGGADGLSRIPCIAPGHPSDLGAVAAVQALLKSVELPGTSANRHKLWLLVPGRDEELLASLRKPNRAVPVLPASRRTLESAWDYAIVVPEPEKVVGIAKALFDRNKPCAVLMPSDLTGDLYFDGDTDTIDQKMKDTVNRCRKIVFLKEGLVWLIHSWPGEKLCEVYSYWSGPTLSQRPIRALTGIIGGGAVSSSRYPEPTPQVWAIRGNVGAKAGRYLLVAPSRALATVKAAQRGCDEGKLIRERLDSGGDYDVVGGGSKP